MPDPAGNSSWTIHLSSERCLDMCRSGSKRGIFVEVAMLFLGPGTGHDCMQLGMPTALAQDYPT
jgi:hypothetical protein